jgi:putative FmdB family regulatory protein
LPLYDYQCRTCSKVTEVRHGFRETYDGTCPECGGELARVFNPAGIVFKGSGFYITDSRKSSGSESGSSSGDGASKSSDVASKPAESGSTSGESKPSGESSPKPSDSGPKKSESSAA